MERGEDGVGWRGEKGAYLKSTGSREEGEKPGSADRLIAALLVARGDICPPNRYKSTIIRFSETKRDEAVSLPS